MSISRLFRLLSIAGGCALSVEAGAAAAGVPLSFGFGSRQFAIHEWHVEHVVAEERQRERADFTPQWAELSIEQRQQMREQIRQHWQSQPAEERERMRAEWQQRSPEDRQRIREEMRARFERMSPEERAHLRDRLREFSPGDPSGIRAKN